MYLKKLKSQNKMFRFTSIFISVCTVILLTVPSSIYYASVNNIYSTTHYTITQDINYDMAISGTANLNPKMQVTICSYKFDFDGYYDGKYLAIFNSWPSNTYFVDISSVNCQITGYDSSSDSIEIQFEGVQHCEIVFKIYQILSSSLANQPPYPNLDFINSTFYTFTYICSSPAYIQERINSKLSDIKGYIDGIEGALSTLANSLVSANTNLVTINSTMIDVYNRQNVTNSTLEDILDAIQDINITVDNDIETTIQNYDDDQIAINNIINTYIQNSHVDSQIYQGFLRDEVSHAYNSATNFASTINSIFNIQGINKSLNFFIEDYFMVMTRAIILIALLG